MLRTLLLTMILILASPGLIFADEEEDYDREGMYFGAGALGAFHLDADSEAEDAREDDGKIASADAQVGTLGVDIRVGYRMDSHWAAEAQIHIIQGTQIKINGVKDAMELETVTFTLNGKYFLLPGRLQPFVLAGVGVMNFDLTEDVGYGSTRAKTSAIGRIGGGADYYLTRSILVAADAQYVFPPFNFGGFLGPAKRLDYFALSLGMQFRF
jgi:outer membrane protein W